MKFSIVKGASKNPYYEPAPTNKLFVDGVQTKRVRESVDDSGATIEHDVRPLWYEEVAYESTNTDVLEDIYEVITQVESENLPYIIIPEKVIRKEDNLFKLSCSEGYLEDNALRCWAQLDIDLEQEGSNWNDLLLRQRLSVALDELPFLSSSTGMVVHLSNKAFIPNPEYADRLSIRIYFRLDKPTTLEDLVLTFSPYEPVIDVSMFRRASVHLVQPPECVGTLKREVQGETVLYLPGEPLSPQKIRSTDDWKCRRAEQTTFNDCVSSVKSWGYDTDEYKQLIDLARTGYFYKNRVKTLYKIIAEAFWTHQKVVEPILELMLSDNFEKDVNGNFTKRKTVIDEQERSREWIRKYTILGLDRGEKELLAIYDKVKQSAINYFIRPISKKQFDYRFTDPREADLQNAKLDDFKSVLVSRMKDGQEPLVGVASPHGSSKTTVLIPLAIEAFREAYPTKEPRVLYISTLRTIVQGMCRKLQLDCYLDSTGKVSQSKVIMANELGVCIKSLQLLAGGKPFDIVILDESEHIGMWSAWDNAPYSMLEDVLSACKLGLLLDADAGDLTYSIIENAARLPQKRKLLLDNTGSWIRTQGQVLNFIPRARMLKQIIATAAIENDEFCFVHTDLADSKGEPSLQIQVDAFNEVAGREIAYKFDRTSPNEERVRLAQDTNGFIEELHKRGIRIILVSPIWQSGLRYSGAINFDRTFGLYMNDFISPKMIVQRIQRVIECRQHYIFISAASHFVKEKELEKQLNEYLGIHEATTDFQWTRDYGKVALQSQAIKLSEIYDSNIKLHTYLYWEYFGGQARFWQDDHSFVEEEDEFSKALSTAKKRLRREEAELILRDEKRLTTLQGLYVNQDGTDYKLPIKTNKQVRDLIARERKAELTEELAYEVFYLLSTDDSEYVNWAFNGEPWKPPSIDDILDGKSAPTEAGYKILGKLLRVIEDYMPIPEEKSILEWLLTGKAPIVIDQRELLQSDILKTADNHKTILDARYDFYRKNITPNNFVKSWFEKVLLCDVDAPTPAKKGLTEAKAKIAEYYMSRGWLHKRKKYPVNAYDKSIKQSIKQKIKDQIELTDAEITYIEETGFVLTIYPPSSMRRSRYEVLSGRVEEMIERGI